MSLRMCRHISFSCCIVTSCQEYLERHPNFLFDEIRKSVFIWWHIAPAWSKCYHKQLGIRSLAIFVVSALRVTVSLRIHVSNTCNPTQYNIMGLLMSCKAIYIQVSSRSTLFGFFTTFIYLIIFICKISMIMTIIAMQSLVLFSAYIHEMLSSSPDVDGVIGLPVVDDLVGALKKLEAFTSFNGPDFYGLPRNT